MCMPSGLAPHLWLSCLQSQDSSGLCAATFFGLWGTCHGLNHFTHAKEAVPLIAATKPPLNMAFCKALAGILFTATGWDAALPGNTKAALQKKNDLNSLQCQTFAKMGNAPASMKKGREIVFAAHSWQSLTFIKWYQICCSLFCWLQD